MDKVLLEKLNEWGWEKLNDLANIHGMELEADISLEEARTFILECIERGAIHPDNVLY